MPCKKLPKEANQPPITTLLSNCTKESKNDQALFRASANSSNSTGAKVSSGTADSTIEAQTELNNKEFIEVESNKKRKRRNRSSGSPKNNPNKKPIMEDPAKNNIDPCPPSPKSDSQTPLNPVPEITLSPELLELERRLNKTMIENTVLLMGSKQH